MKLLDRVFKRSNLLISFKEIYVDGKEELVIIFKSIDQLKEWSEVFEEMCCGICLKPVKDDDNFMVAVGAINGDIVSKVIFCKNDYNCYENAVLKCRQEIKRLDKAGYIGCPEQS